MIDFFSRLDKYMEIKGLNDNKITIEANISNGLIGKARKRGSLSQENISKILYTYSDINANWLLTGKGSMLKEASPNFVSEPQASYLGNPNQNLDRENELKTQLKDKERIISMLEKEVLRLENELKKFTL